MFKKIQHYRSSVTARVGGPTRSHPTSSARKFKERV